MLIIHGSFLLIVAMLSSFGDASVAANSVGLRVQSFAFVPGLAISQATSAMVGASLGASDVLRARTIARASLSFTVIVMIVLGVLLAAASPAILAVFAVRSGTGVYALATTWMRVLGLSLPIAGANIALVGVLRGAGATTTSLLVNVLGTLVVQVPASYLLAYTAGFGTLGIWLAVPVAFVARLLLSTGFYHRGAWARTGEL
jgi:Na+-driven multidrug efflux pump